MICIVFDMHIACATDGARALSVVTVGVDQVARRLYHNIGVAQVVRRSYHNIGVAQVARRSFHNIGGAQALLQHLGQTHGLPQLLFLNISNYFCLSSFQL